MSLVSSSTPFVGDRDPDWSESRSRVAESKGIFPTKSINFFHEIGVDLDSFPQSREIFVDGPTRIVAKSEVILTATRNARSPEYVATLRRKLADKIRSLVSGLAQEADRPDFAVATHPIVAAIRRALEQLSDAEFEGNAREILRQIRDSMMNGGWEKYRDTHVRDIAVQGARLLSTKDEVGPSDVEKIRKSFLDADVAPVRVVMGGLDDEEDPC